MYGEGRELGPVGTRLLYSNDLVNVWEVALEPGESQPWHRHDHPYLVVSLLPGHCVVTPVTGDPRDVDEHPGMVVFRPPSEAHRLDNVGKTPVRTRLIEFKTTNPGPFEPAVVPAPDQQ